MTTSWVEVVPRIAWAPAACPAAVELPPLERRWSPEPVPAPALPRAARSGRPPDPPRAAAAARRADLAEPVPPAPRPPAARSQCRARAALLRARRVSALQQREQRGAIVDRRDRRRAVRRRPLPRVEVPRCSCSRWTSSSSKSWSRLTYVAVGRRPVVVRGRGWSSLVVVRSTNSAVRRAEVEARCRACPTRSRCSRRRTPSTVSTAVIRCGPGRNTTWPSVTVPVCVSPSAACQRSTAAVGGGVERVVDRDLVARVIAERDEVLLELLDVRPVGDAVGQVAVRRDGAV